jgi:hypothetical protein
VGKETRVEREPERRGELDAAVDRWLRCIACGHAITREASRIEVDGKHVHTFVNPGGYEYTIRCFRDAPGCAGSGEESTFWSWFPGFAWCIALCASCGAQLGWSFRHDAGAFWGLIAERIA